MFDDLIKELGNLEKSGISIPLQADEKGYLDRQCQSQNCEFDFKIYEDDWEKIEKENASAYCPRCRHEAPVDQWETKLQIESANEQVVKILDSKINSSLNRSAKKFNRSQRGNGFISISMSVSPKKSEYVLVPIGAAAELQQEISCSKCATKFSVLGSAYFCPGCGHSSITSVFMSSISHIENNILHLGAMRESLGDSTDPDTADQICQKFVESFLGNIVTSFQLFCDGLYEATNPEKAAKVNVFQRLEDASDLWWKRIEWKYSDTLSDNQLDELKYLFQLRHLLQHKDGLVDQKFIDQKTHHGYRIGQRVVVTKDHVSQSALLVKKLASELLNKVQEKFPEINEDSNQIKVEEDLTHSKIKGIDEIDSFVLKRLCEHILETGDDSIAPEQLFFPSIEEGIYKKDELIASMEVLDELGYLRNSHYIGGGSEMWGFRVRVSSQGFEIYARSCLFGYNDLKNKIILLLCNGELNTDAEIAKELDAQLLIVQHVFTFLEDSGDVKLTEYDHGGMHVWEISAMLKRKRLRTSSDGS